MVAILILSLGIHEAAHAWVASLCGDSTAKSMGRMTLNPIPHIDPIMTVLLPGFLVLSGSPFVFGGAKPVPVVYQRLRKPARDMMLVALAGPISNLLIALFLLVILKVFVYTQDMSMGANDPVRVLLSVRPGTATILTQVLSQSVGRLCFECLFASRSSSALWSPGRVFRWRLAGACGLLPTREEPGAHGPARRRGRRARGALGSEGRDGYVDSHPFGV